jgi:hypothetical protein
MSVHHVSDGRVHLLINSGGPRPRALGSDHVTDAVPKPLLGDECVREKRQSRERDVRGLIPQTSFRVIIWLGLWIKNWRDSMNFEVGGGKTHK